MQHFHIIQALCRSALSNPSNAVIQQVQRLRAALIKDGLTIEAKSLEGLLNGTEKASEMSPSRIERSQVLVGEELTRRTQLPVDKETSAPLCEVIFTNDTPTESPIFDADVELAIHSVLEEWRNHEKLSAIQAQPSKSCLIYGAPGTGKTHLALWLARQLDIPVVIARLDGLMSSFLGTTSRNVGSLFAFAARFRCILLLDEFDAIAKLRNDTQEVGEIKRVVNTLLQNLDSRKGFTIGITNHESLLDPAIWRRFDVQIEIPKPSPEVMESVIRKFQDPLELNETEIRFLSWSIENSSGADAAAMVRWMKKSMVLEKETARLVDKIRRFAILNTGRIDPQKKHLFANSDSVLASALLEDKRYSFKHKDVAHLLDISPSNLSKKLAKGRDVEN